MQLKVILIHIQSRLHFMNHDAGRPKESHEELSLCTDYCVVTKTLPITLKLKSQNIF